MNRYQSSQRHQVPSAACAVAEQRRRLARPVATIFLLVGLLMLLAGVLAACGDMLGGQPPPVQRRPHEVVPMDIAAPTSFDEEPVPLAAGATQVVRVDDRSLSVDEDEGSRSEPSTTPGLNPSLALTATAVWTVYQKTPVPPPPMTGGGPGGDLVGQSVTLPTPGELDRDQRNNPFYNREDYAHVEDNPFVAVAGQDALSTFAIDVDTASYSNVRRYLDSGQMPPPDAVRIEELINYFDYDYPEPEPDDPNPFAVMAHVVEAPWNSDHRLLHVALKGRTVDDSNRKPRNLVFLIDVSGSMNHENKLPLVQDSLRLLVEELRPQDSVAMVVYAGSSGLVLPSTPGDDEEAILDAIDRLQAGGSTNGGQGIQLAYDVAADAYDPAGVNRVILATDGDFNVGVTSHGDLLRLIEREARRDVSLTVLGFGMGNLNDATLEQLADHGDGNYGYVDTIGEAEKLLVHQADATLETIAKDVKVQIEFNPAAVSAYRQIGYENRALEHRDFADDTKDAGEIGAGHSVTALYELVPAGAEPESDATVLPGVAPLRYQATGGLSEAAESEELLTLALRYKEPEASESALLAYTVVDEGKSMADAHGGAGFSAAVAAFGMMLRESPHRGEASWDLVLELTRDRIGDDPYGYRADFVRLVETARDLAARRAARGATGPGA